MKKAIFWLKAIVSVVSYIWGLGFVVVLLFSSLAPYDTKSERPDPGTMEAKVNNFFEMSAFAEWIFMFIFLSFVGIFVYKIYKYKKQSEKVFEYSIISNLIAYALAIAGAFVIPIKFGFNIPMIIFFAMVLICLLVAQAKKVYR